VYAEPNCITGYLPIIPNDERFPNQWALNNSGQYGGTPDADIDAPEVWDIEKGSSDIVIASIDSGVDYNHEDLAGNIWTNDDEIPNNGMDDDNNGYIDDIVGWDFYENDSTPLDDPSAPQYGHGTRCAGVHSAATNNSIGLAGICWNCITMVVRCYYNYYDIGFYAKGIKYAADNKADVINIEMGIEQNFQLIKDAVNYAYGEGCFICAPAGNSNTSTPYYPAAYENVVAVGATNQRDERCDESDWGEGRGSNWGDWLDVAAPGNSLWLLNPNDNYVFFPGGGTSPAAPHVAGLAGLLLSLYPSFTPADIKSFICDNVDPYVPTKYYIGTGRINAHKALSAAIAYVPDLVCEGNLHWENVSADSTQTGNFEIENIGGNASLLDWSISKYPSWGEWTFDPMSGNGLASGASETIQVTVISPPEKNKEFNGTIKIRNSDFSEDSCTIQVKLTTPKNKPYNINLPFQRFLENHPNLFQILRELLLL
jgi:subtilisin family serine protease